jgi:hypothetical protein
MRKALVAVSLVALIPLAAVALARPEPPSWRLKLGATVPQSVLGIQNTRKRTRLLRVDSRTLEPLSGPRLIPGSGSSFSPDGSRLAFGDRFGEVSIVDALGLRVVGKISADYGQVVATAWLGGRVLAVVDPCCRSEDPPDRELSVSVLDPIANSRISAHVLAESGERVEGAAHAGSLFVLLLGPRWSLGAARLVTVDAEGDIRSAALDLIPSGQEFETAGRMSAPGLAVDAAGGRAYVVAGNAPVAEIDLATLAVSYHELSTPISVLSHVRNWLEPEAAAKMPSSGPMRHASWLGNDLLAVWGSDIHVTGSGRSIETSETAAGVKLIDTRNWSVRTLDANASSLAVAEGTLLVSASLWSSAERRAAGIGLTAYNPDGSARFHLFGSRPLWVQVLGSRAFVPRGGRRQSYDIVDVRTGRVIRRMRGFMPDPLLPSCNSPCWR